MDKFLIQEDPTLSQTFEPKMIKPEWLIQNIPGGILVCKKDDTILYISNGFFALTGYSETEINEIFDRKYLAIIVPEDSVLLQNKIETQRKDHQNFAAEYRIKRKDGAIIWILDQSVFMQSSATTEHLLIDITEQKAREEQLITSEKCYRAAMHSFHMTSFKYDSKTKKITFSPLTIEEFHFPEVMENAVENMINTGIIQPDSIDNYRELFQKIAEGSPREKADISVKDLTGKLRIFRFNLINIFDDNGQSIGAFGLRQDITKTTSLKKEKKFGETFASNKLLAYEADVSRNIVIYYDKTWAEDIGINRITSFFKMIDFLHENIVAPEDKNMFREQLSKSSILKAFAKGQKLISFEYRKKSADGSYRWFEKTISMIKEESTGDIIIRCYILDIHDRKEKELHALEEQKLYQEMLSKANIVYDINFTKNIFVSEHEDLEGLFGMKTPETYSNLIDIVSEKIFAEDKDAFLKAFTRGNVLIAFADGERKITCEYRRPDKNKKVIWVLCTLHLYEETDTEEIKGHAYLEDIDQSKKAQLALIYKSEHDLLTGFYNKETTKERIEFFLATGDAQTGVHAFFMIDLDHFKTLNDSFGHAFGDAILSEKSAQIKGLFRDADICGRVGGDEFVVLMKDIHDEKRALSKAQEICSTVAESYTQNGVNYNVSVSVGIAFRDEHAKSYDALYKNSDIALYAAKQQGRNCFYSYNTTMKKGKTALARETLQSVLEEKNFQDHVGEFVFRILYETQDKNSAINAVLALVGKHYNVSRACVFENSVTGKYARNTFEWCNKEIAPQMADSQHLSCENGCIYKEELQKNGIWYVPNTEDLPPDIKKIAVPKNIKSMIYFSIVRNGTFGGFIGFDECKFFREFSDKEIYDMRMITSILGVFIFWMRDEEQSQRQLTDFNIGEI